MGICYTQSVTYGMIRYKVVSGFKWNSYICIYRYELRSGGLLDGLHWRGDQRVEYTDAAPQ